MLKLTTIGFAAGILAAALSFITAGAAGFFLIKPIAPPSWGMLGFLISGGVEYGAIGLAVAYIRRLAGRPAVS